MMVALAASTKKQLQQQRSKRGWTDVGVVVILVILVAVSTVVWVNLQILSLASNSSASLSLIATNVNTPQQQQPWKLAAANSKPALVAEQAPQKQQQQSQDDDSLEGYRARVKDKIDLNRNQTTDGGAFVHLGKTGGSSLSVLLTNGCHSWIQHPCRTIEQETPASQRISSYYHVADFGLLPQSNHDFYVLTLRDPYDRTISAFVYEHYLNVQARGETNHVNRRVRAEFQQACEQCFPTLEKFVHWLTNGTDFSYPYKRNQVVFPPCQDLARAVFHGRVRIFHHLYFNYQRIQSLIPNVQDKVLLVTRLEHLWNDWDALNRYLVQVSSNNHGGEPIKQPRPSFSETAKNEHDKEKEVKHVRNTADLKLPVTRDLSEEGRQVLCRALQPEYDAYFWFISRARNLKKTDIVHSLLYAREKCPKLHIDFKAMQQKPKAQSSV